MIRVSRKDLTSGPGLESLVLSPRFPSSPSPPQSRHLSPERSDLGPPAVTAPTRGPLTHFPVLPSPPMARSASVPSTVAPSRPSSPQTQCPTPPRQWSFAPLRPLPRLLPSALLPSTVHRPPPQRPPPHPRVPASQWLPTHPQTPPSTVPPHK